MPEMSDRELLALVEGEFHNAMGAADGEISAERALAWDYYLSKELGNEVDGRSKVVTSDVADIVDGIMPSLLRIFTTAENLVDFDPVGPEDEEKAEQESDYVNHVFFKQNPAFWILFSWFFDALVQKNGIVKAWWDESEEVTTESYQGLTEEELTVLMEDEELEAVERAEREGTTVQTVLTEVGELQTEVETTLHDVVFQRTSKSGRPRIEPVPPEEYRVSADSRELDPSDARMVGHEREMARSDLLDMGFDEDVVEDLPAHGDVRDSNEDIARYDKSDEDDDGPHDRSQDQILVREAYIRVDFDGDGRSELRQVITAGNEILSNEEVDRQPFHVISPQPLPHKHFGRATAEKVMDIQQVNTTLVRQILDNLYQSNNPGHAVWEQGIGENTLDDLLTSRVGSVKRFARPVQESWAQINVPFVAGQTFPMLEYWDKVKRDRTGVSSDSEGLSPDALKNIQSSVLAQATDIAKQKIEMVARVFAETGIKTLFLHLHELLLKHQRKEEVVRLRNRWVPVDPRSWRTRKDITVRIGLGIGNREQNLLHLDTIWQKQREMIEAGGLGLTVTPRNVFNTASEFVKNANLKTPELFFRDPGEEMPQQQGNDAQAQLMQAQLRIEKERNQLRQQDQAMQHQREIEKMSRQHQREVEKLSLQREKQESDMLVKMEEIANKLTELELEFNRNVPGSKV